MNKRWLYLIVLLGASTWLSWQFVQDLQAHTAVTAVNAGLFVFGPASFLFFLGAVFGALWLRPQAVDIDFVYPGQGREEWPQPKREPNGHSAPPPVRDARIPREPSLHEQGPAFNGRIRRIRQQPPRGGRSYH
jgi:hypothetical protein